MRSLAGLAGLLVLAACGLVEPRVETGRAAYMDHCSACHGRQARGDGTMAVFVSSGVPDLRQLSAANGGAFPRAHVVRTITRISDRHEGIAPMPDFGALLNARPRTFVTPQGERIRTDAVILAVADYLEQIQDKPSH